jgi:D-tyrosyl-tRNA(Tyr) deacylase
MRLVVQAVERAEVLIHDTGEKNSIGKGILIYFGVHRDDIIDGTQKIDKLVEKIGNMRRLKTSEGRLDATLGDIGGEIMVISNFTLYASNEKGTKMSFSQSAVAADAEPVYEYFVQGLRDAGWTVATGKFGAMMEVSAVTMGPINYVWDV